MCMGASPQQDSHTCRCTREAQALTNRSGAGEMSMNPLFRRLTCLLLMTAMIVSFVVLSAPGLVHAAATCTPQATLPADTPPVAHSMQVPM